MGRRKLFPKGKGKRTNININSDFQKETMKEVNQVLGKYHLLPGETESQYIQRIQSMHLDNCENQTLKK